MEKLILLILAIGGFILFLRWHESNAEKELEGNVTPGEIGEKPQHPDGVLYYFYHPMCGPCQQIEPVIDQLIQKYPDRVEKLNVEECQDIVLTMRIKSTPTTVFVKNGKIMKAIIGYKSEKVLETLLLAS